jgi:hypothetical protein
MGPFKVRVGRGGRITLPATLRGQLRLQEGSEVHLLIVPPPPTALRTNTPAPVPGRRTLPSRPRWRNGAVERWIDDMLFISSIASSCHAMVLQWLLSRSQEPPYNSPVIEGVLNTFAERCRRQVLSIRGQNSTSRVVAAWRFPDNSVIAVPHGRNTTFTAAVPSIEVQRRSRRLIALDPDGLGKRAMEDGAEPVRAALRRGRHDLVELYVRHHSQLPELDLELRLIALEAPSEEVRLAAMPHRSKGRVSADERRRIGAIGPPT